MVQYDEKRQRQPERQRPTDWPTWGWKPWTLANLFSFFGSMPAQRPNPDCPSSGYVSLDSNGDVKNRIPLKIRKELCLLLDRKEKFNNDWRMLAEEMGCPSGYIRAWEGEWPYFSPIDQLLRWWESGHTERFPLEKIHQTLLLKLERVDAAEVIEQCLQRAEPFHPSRTAELCRTDPSSHFDR